MTRFWKFTSFVGTIGIVLLLTAFFVGYHSYYVYPLSETIGKDAFLSRGIVATLVTDDRSAYFGIAGAACVAWQFVMTVLGMLAGFFGAPVQNR